ncbi:MAG: kynureninase, partial [Actinomycetota bacterium]
RQLPRLDGGGWHELGRHLEAGARVGAPPARQLGQLSNAPILAMAALRASLELFAESGGMSALRAKTERQLAYFDFLLDEVVAGRAVSLTPVHLDQRGCQYSLRVEAAQHGGREVHRRLEEAGVACDWREPDVIRVAPVPLYNSFADIRRFVTLLDQVLG